MRRPDLLILVEPSANRPGHRLGMALMGGDGANGPNILGELRGLEGPHVVDGAVLPSLPAKHATLTIMANADRIGRALARR